MSSFNFSSLTALLVTLSFMLILGRILGEIVRKLKQPSVIGEIIAGILLGPSILGYYFPSIYNSLLVNHKEVSNSLSGIVYLAVIFLLFIAGLEVELGIVMKNVRKATSISFFGMIVPFVLGFFLPLVFQDLFHTTDDNERIYFALFLGTAFSITALPVMARILMDINLIKTPIGSIVLSSAMANDLLGWLIFSIILGLINHANGHDVIYKILITLAFTAFVLTIGRILISKGIKLVTNKLAWPGGILSYSISLCLLGAAFTEYIGIHAIFGAFLMGIAIGDSVHFSNHIKEILHQFINNIFAPLFFVSIGIKVNFIQNFDLPITIVIVIIAFAAKLVGAGLGAKIVGFKFREAMVIGSGMLARGAMEIIIGLLALEAKIINESIFVALVILALLTSIVSGPMMKFFYRKPQSTK